MIPTVKQEARDYLVKLGTHNPDGTITKEYGGEYTTKDDNDDQRQRLFTIHKRHHWL